MAFKGFQTHSNRVQGAVPPPVDLRAVLGAWLAEVEASDARDGWVPLRDVAKRLGLGVNDLCHWLFREGIHRLRVEMSGFTCEDARMRILDERGGVLRTLAAIPLALGIMFLMMLLGEMFG